MSVTQLDFTGMPARLPALARRMTGSRLAAALAGAFIVCDGMYLVDSRVAVIDIVYLTCAAIAYLLTSNFKWDARVEAGLEVGALLGFLLCCQGAIWAKPTWGVWWDWDPRLTSTAVLLCSFAGILALRRFVDDPARRAILCASTASSRGTT